MIFCKACGLLLLTMLSSVVINADNPSGDCVDTTGTNGARIGYHSPAQTDTYLPDCQNPLQRELWRVFEKADGTAYIIPRPDGLADESGLCSSSGSSSSSINEVYHQKAEQYGLCDNNAALMNSMSPADALLFTNIFHRKLRFEASEYGSITPFAPDDDILAACALLVDGSSLQLDSQGYCESVANRCTPDGTCLDIGILPSAEAVRALVPALNALYGVPEVGESCDPAQWGTPTVGSCPVADCATRPAGTAAGCEYAVGEFAITPDGDCCEKQCYLVDPLSGLSCSLELEPQRCNPVVFGTDPAICPVAGCTPPPTGCTYASGIYEVDDAGNCCEKQCYAINGFGNNDCSLTTTSTTITTATTEDTPMVGALCTQVGNEACAVARCAAPPQGCQYKFDHNIMDESGTCCPALCYAVDVNGNECTNAQGVSSAQDAGADDEAEEQQCTPTGTEISCPVASCAPAPQGCEYKFDHYLLNDRGTCCPALCYAVDANGNECLPQQQQGEDTITTTTIMNEGDEEMVQCVPNGDESCPTAKCMQAPENCEYKHDHFVLTDNGVCCPALCYAVDSEGNKCGPNSVEEEAMTATTTTTTTNATDWEVGDACVPQQQFNQSTAATTAMTKQASGTTTTTTTTTALGNADKCPVAGCTEAPPGCTYVEGPYFFNDEGHCCPELCYAVDSNGNPCSNEGVLSSIAYNSSATEYGWLLTTVLAVAHYFFGN